MNRSFKYGDGFFETIRVEEGRPTLWPFHVDRVLSSCDVMGVELLSSDAIEAILRKLLKESENMGLARARITFYRSGGGRYAPESNMLEHHLEIEPMNAVEGSIFPTHSGNFSDLLRDVRALPGRKVGLYPDASRIYTPFSMLKSTSAMLYVQAARYAAQMEWDDAFVQNEKGHIIEMTDSSIYAVYNDRIYTPSISSGCVAGVCRAYLMDRYDLLEASLSREDLGSADMVFCSNALHGVRRVETAF